MHSCKQLLIIITIEYYHNVWPQSCLFSWNSYYINNSFYFALCFKGFLFVCGRQIKYLRTYCSTFHLTFLTIGSRWWNVEDVVCHSLDMWEMAFEAKCSPCISVSTYGACYTVHWNARFWDRTALQGCLCICLKSRMNSNSSLIIRLQTHYLWHHMDVYASLHIAFRFWSWSAGYWQAVSDCTILRNPLKLSPLNLLNF